MGKGRLGLLASFVIAAACHAAGAVEFAALAQIGDQRRFVLRDDRGPSDWLTLGQSFHGYTIVSFDPTQEVLTVRQTDRVLELPLRGSHVQAMTGPAVADELAAAGITSDDLVVRDSGPVRITLAVERSAAPLAQRIIDVQFRFAGGTAGVAFGADGPQAIRRGFAPEAVRDAVTDADLDAINVCLATVRAKLRGAPN